MKASQYRIKECVLDKKENIHVLLVNEDMNVFIPLYVSQEDGNLLLLQGEDFPDEAMTILSFYVYTLARIGYTINSIIIDKNPKDGLLIPSMTLFQNQFDQRLIYVTTFIPVTVALLFAGQCDIPLYLTSTFENNSSKISLHQIDNYIKNIMIGDKNEERN